MTLPASAVLMTLAICPTRQSVRAIVDLCVFEAYSDEDWRLIQAAAEERLLLLGDSAQR